MRGLLAIAMVPIVLLAAAGVGVFMCWLMGVNPQINAMIIAGVGSMVAGGLASAPVLLSINSTQAGMAQAGLISTAVHLMGHAVVAGIVIMGKLPVSGGFVYWLMAFYLVTLVLLCSWLVGVIRRAPMDTASSSSGSGKQ